MKYSLELRAEAEQEIIDAGSYYEQQQEGLGRRFIDHVESYFVQILKSPKRYPEKNPPYREVYIQKFPFIVIYRIYQEQVIILSVFNAHRDPENKY